MVGVSVTTMGAVQPQRKTITNKTIILFTALSSCNLYT
jgi:hypothetical protein